MQAQRTDFCNFAQTTTGQAILAQLDESATAQDELRKENARENAEAASGKTIEQAAREAAELAQAREADERAQAIVSRPDWEMSESGCSLKAAQLTGDLHRRRAQIAADGGKAKFPALLDSNGKRIKAKIINAKYGRVWAVLDEQNEIAQFIALAPVEPREALPPADDKSEYAEMLRREHKKYAPALKRWEKKYNVRRGYEMAPAGCDYSGNGRGMAGMYSLTLRTYRTDDGTSGEPVEAGPPGTN